jgi:hypothetical protein
VRQRQGGRHLLTPMGCPNQAPHRHQRQRHVVRPPLPGAPLRRGHADLALASLTVRCNAGARLDPPCPFPPRWLLAGDLGPTGRRAGIMLARPRVLRGGIARGAGLPPAVVRPGPTGDHQPRRGAGALALPPRLPPALAQLDGHWSLRAVAHRQAGPGPWSARLAPIGSRWPGGRWAAVHGRRRRATGRVGRAAWWGKGPPARNARRARVAQPRVATARSIACHPPGRPLLPPCSAPRPARRVPRGIPPLLGPMAGRTPSRGSSPVLGEGQAAVAQGLVVVPAVAPAHAPLAGVAVAPGPTPRALAPHRGGPTRGAAARLEGAEAIGLAPALGHVAPQRRAQWVSGRNRAKTYGKGQAM